MGIAQAGTNVANIFGPPLFILIALLQLGWRTCFALMGGLGFLWLPLWFFSYHLPKPKDDSVESGSKIFDQGSSEVQASMGRTLGQSFLPILFGGSICFGCRLT